MKVLGISAYYHDSAAAVIDDGKIIAAAQEERFTRIKNDASFPINAINYCLGEMQVTLNELDAIVFYDKPFLKFERLLETYINNAPRGLVSFISAMPVWLKEKLFLRSAIKKALKKYDSSINWNKTQLLFSQHHVSHAASAFFASCFNDSAILCIDGVGEWATASIAKGSGNKIELLQEMHFPDSAGLLYSAFTYYLGFKVNEGEYKVMGLAPYAVNQRVHIEPYKQKIYSHIVTVFDDGSIKLNPEYFRYATSLKMINEKKFETLFELKRRLPEEEIIPAHCAMALALQEVLEDIVLKMAAYAKKITGARNLCMAGGVALNCVANGKLKEKDLFDQVFIQPAAGDAGGALGAALAAYYLHFKATRIITAHADEMNFCRLGPSYKDTQIDALLQNSQLKHTKYEHTDDLLELTAQLLAEGKVIAWFEGRMEFGPRALGNRSILANPAIEHMQSELNLKVKKRESFRPFAPVMLQEEFTTYFGQEYESPYMLFVHKMLSGHCKPNSGFTGNLFETINQNRSVLPAITHIDYSSRIQTVSAESNKKLNRLLTLVKRRTGFGVLINTSFNVKDEPIVCTPSDALDCFKQTAIDVLVLENYVVIK
ncbi:MAG: carbamoyltransferase N-terminal domain-containing protein [Bacteroidota bacterium]